MLRIKSFDEQIASIALTMSSNRFDDRFSRGAMSLRRSNISKN